MAIRENAGMVLDRITMALETLVIISLGTLAHWTRATGIKKMDPLVKDTICVWSQIVSLSPFSCPPWPSFSSLGIPQNMLPLHWLPVFELPAKPN